MLHTGMDELHYSYGLLIVSDNGVVITPSVNNAAITMLLMFVDPINLSLILSVCVDTYLIHYCLCGVLPWCVVDNGQGRVVLYSSRDG